MFKFMGQHNIHSLIIRIILIDENEIEKWKRCVISLSIFTRLIPRLSSISLFRINEKICPNLIKNKRINRVVPDK